ALRANVKLASANMNGRTHADSGHSPTSKWIDVHRVMKHKKIGILALQETHLNATHEADLATIYQRRLIVMNSRHPTNPSASAGVAFVLNKDVIKTDKYTATELIPGRAIALRIEWRDGQTLDLINIYAPNDESEHPAFWKNLVDRWRETQPQDRLPDMMMGDFNLVEDPIDRSPPHPNADAATTALRDARHTLKLQDAWRHTYPTERIFTFRSNSANSYSQSRIDRIYTKENHTPNLYEWTHSQTSIPTDHDMVTVKFSPTTAPHIGTGRWTMPLYLLNDKNLMLEIIKMGALLESSLDALEGNRTNENNTQREWDTFKKKLTKRVKKYAQTKTGKTRARIADLQKDAKSLRDDPAFDADENVRRNEAIINDEIRRLEGKLRTTARNTSKAQYTVEGERPTKYWTGVNADKKPRDIIPRLRIVNSHPRRYITHSKQMAELARQYHDDLQMAGRNPNESEAHRQAVINGVTAHIPDNQLLPPDKETSLASLLEAKDVEASLLGAKLGTAAGIDGCPYELWKKIITLNKTAKKEHRPTFDITKTLQRVYNDIQLHGVDETTQFTLGWMCPIYKKNDRTEIANYRPITLLNTDYKIFTKTLATQL
ncbi:DNase I-like protein, partial [Dentipellis sp. KUC8613]